MRLTPCTWKTGTELYRFTLTDTFRVVEVMQCATGRELTMKHIKHAAGSGGVLNVAYTSYKNVRTIIR